MLKQLLIIFLFVSLGSAMSGQEQVSDIENIGYVFPDVDRGFISHSGNEYLIEQGEQKTKISILENGEITLLHSISYRPNDGQLQHDRDYRKNNSGIFTQNETLFEIYDFNVLMINFVSGELMKNIDLCEYDVSYDSGFTLFDNKILFKGSHLNESVYCVYNLENDQFEILEWTRGKTYYQADLWLYEVDDENNMIYGYSIETEMQEFELQVEEGIKRIYVSYNMNEPQLKITSTNETVFEIAKDQLIYSCDCFVNSGAEVLESYYRDGIIYAHTYKDFVGQIVAKNVQTCEDFIDLEELPKGAQYMFLDNKELNDRYLILSAPSRHYMIDIEEKSVHNLNISIDILFSYESLIIDNTLYIKGFEYVDWSGYHFYCLGVNLDDKSSFVVPIQEDKQFSELVIGEKRSDGKIHFLTLEAFESGSLLEYDIASNSAIPKVEGLDVSNLGVLYVLHSLKVGSKYYYADGLGVYVVNDNNVQQIIEGDAVMPLVEREGKISGMVLQDEQLYSFEIDTEDDSWDTLLLDDFDKIDYRTLTTDHVIFHLTNYNTGKGYLDLDTREFVRMAESVGTSSFKIPAVSGDNAMIYTFEFNNRGYQLFNTDTKDFVVLDHLAERYEAVVGDGFRGFYLVGKGDAQVESRKFIHLDENGVVVDELELDFSIPYYADIWSLNEDLLIYPLPGDNEIHLVMSRNDDLRIKTLPFENTLYYTRFFIRNDKDRSLIEHIDDGERKVTYISYDDDPINLFDGDASDELLEAIFSNDKVALFYKIDLENKLRIDIYNLVSKELVSSEKYTISKESFGHTAMLGKLSNTVSLVHYDDGVHGQEPFVFDIETGDFYLLEDMSEGHLDSELEDFVKLQDYSYFTALSEDRSRQWFRILGENFTKIEEIETSSDLGIYPNPTSDIICTDEKIVEYEIYGINGTLCRKISNNKSRNIDVSDLPDGFYILKGRNDLEQEVQGNFMVQK